jgi:hypothetical protein
MLQTGASPRMARKRGPAIAAYILFYVSRDGAARSAISRAEGMACFFTRDSRNFFICFRAGL